jgi:hypothetical protein
MTTGAAVTAYEEGDWGDWGGGGGGGGVELELGYNNLGARNAFLEPFLYINDHFTKTGSGQT